MRGSEYYTRSGSAPQLPAPHRYNYRPPSLGAGSGGGLGNGLVPSPSHARRDERPASAASVPSPYSHYNHGDYDNSANNPHNSYSTRSLGTPHGGGYYASGGSGVLPTLRPEDTFDSWGLTAAPPPPPPSRPYSQPAPSQRPMTPPLPSPAPGAATFYQRRPITVLPSSMVASSAPPPPSPPHSLSSAQATTFDIELSEFRLTVHDPRRFPPPYTLRGVFSLSITFASEWAYPSTTAAAAGGGDSFSGGGMVSWRLRPHFQCELDGLDGSSSSSHQHHQQQQQKQRYLLIECYCGSSPDGSPNTTGSESVFMGSCRMSVAELLQCPRDQPTQLTLTTAVDGPGAAGAVSFQPAIAQVSGVVLGLSEVVLSPNPLPYLFPQEESSNGCSGLMLFLHVTVAGAEVRLAKFLKSSTGEEGEDDDAHTDGCGVLSSSPSSSRATAFCVPASFSSLRAVEWRGLPPLAVVTTLAKLTGATGQGGGVRFTLYAGDKRSGAAAARGGGSIAGLVPVGSFLVRPSESLLMQPPYRGEEKDDEGQVVHHHLQRSYAFHTEVQLTTGDDNDSGGGGGGPALCWARGEVRRQSGGGYFTHRQPQAGPARQGPHPHPSPPPARRPAAASQNGGRNSNDNEHSSRDSPVASSAAGVMAPSSLVARGGSDGSGAVTEGDAAAAAPESQVLDCLAAQQSALVDGIRDRLRAVQARRHSVALEVARVRAQQTTEMRAAAERRGRLESDRAECLERLESLHVQLAEVQSRREALAREYGAMDAERRAAAGRAAEERAEVGRIRARLVTLQADMQGRLAAEERRLAARVATAQAAGAHAERGARWLTEVEGRLVVAAERAGSGGNGQR